MFQIDGFAFDRGRSLAVMMSALHYLNVERRRSGVRSSPPVPFLQFFSNWYGHVIVSLTLAFEGSIVPFPYKEYLCIIILNPFFVLELSFNI